MRRLRAGPYTADTGSLTTTVHPVSDEPAKATSSFPCPFRPTTPSRMPLSRLCSSRRSARFATLRSVAVGSAPTTMCPWRSTICTVSPSRSARSAGRSSSRRRTPVTTPVSRCARLNAGTARTMIGTRLAPDRIASLTYGRCVSRTALTYWRPERSTFSVSDGGRPATTAPLPSAWTQPMSSTTSRRPSIAWKSARIAGRSPVSTGPDAAIPLRYSSRIATRLEASTAVSRASFPRSTRTSRFACLVPLHREHDPDGRDRGGDHHDGHREPSSRPRGAAPDRG